MAEITGGNTGSGKLAVRIEILEKVRGMFAGRGSLRMNAAMGVVRAQVTFVVGDEEIFSHDVLLHRMSVDGWATGVEMLVEGKMGERKEVGVGVESPELEMRVVRRDLPDIPQFKDALPSYELLVLVDSGALNPEEDIAHEGPAMYLEPDADRLVQFARDLRDETEQALTPRLFRKRGEKA
ncbi:MAG: hypothetical protein JW900_07175 [Anaerolineae bacterium]|nr:hypothetical protein [Anaerolineae bacterium]